MRISMESYMRAMAATGAYAVIVAFLLSEFCTAQCISDSQVKCTTVPFPDVLKLSKCLHGTWDVCTSDKEEEESPARKLAKCLINSEMMPAFVSILIDKFRNGITFVLDPFSPQAAHQLFATLKQMTHNQQERTAEPRRLYTPDQCRGTLNVSVSDPQRTQMQKCAHLAFTACNQRGHLRRNEISALLLSSGVCTLRYLPTVSVPDLLKNITCLALETLLDALRRTRKAPTLLPVLEFLQLALQCEQPVIIKPNAERRMLKE
ncbi:uncharacterized protein LOC144139044 [Haemaphysalis longicornis]